MSICKYCNKEFEKRKIGGHVSLCVKNPNNKRNILVYCKYCDKKISKLGIVLHERYCEYNLNRSTNLILYADSFKKEHRNIAISNGMKKAHAEGRAWNIGYNRHISEPSYPEKFFMKVIENEFEDKNYIREYQVGKYSIDFAWIEKMLAIEIDGQQHERPELKLRDERKDQLLESLGWKILRIKWTDMCNNAKFYIQKAKEFIQN